LHLSLFPSISRDSLARIELRSRGDRLHATHKCFAYARGLGHFPINTRLLISYSMKCETTASKLCTNLSSLEYELTSSTSQYALRLVQSHRLCSTSFLKSEYIIVIMNRASKGQDETQTVSGIPSPSWSKHTDFLPSSGLRVMLTHCCPRACLDNSAKLRSAYGPTF
jgi:hypothetical protein